MISSYNTIFHVAMFLLHVYKLLNKQISNLQANLACTKPYIRLERAVYLCHILGTDSNDLRLRRESPFPLGVQEKTENSYNTI